MSFIVNNTTLPNLLDLIAPHICLGCGTIGKPICEKCKNYIMSEKCNICPNCRNTISTHKCPHCPNFPPSYIVGKRHGLLDITIHTYKYNSNRSLAQPLAELMYNRLKNDYRHAIIVPLPTATNHIRQRGLDHTLLLAKHLAKLTSCQIQPVLHRNHNATQVGADRITRLEQAEHAYSISPRFIVDPNTTYILLDDIWTTGASMKKAIEKMQKAGAKKIVVALLAISQLK
jgi:ComF family protein